MEKLAMLIGVALLGCALVAVGLYAWNGHWLPVLLTISAAFVGKMALGFVELLLTPISLPLMHFAKRGNTPLSFIFATLLAVVGRTLFAAYCAAVLLYFVRTPGPPTWLAVALAAAVASAPFHWAANRSTDESHPAHMDLIAALLGVAISGALLAFGVQELIAFIPLAVLFSISAIVLVYWWMTRGASLARLNHLLNQ